MTSVDLKDLNKLLEHLTGVTMNILLVFPKVSYVPSNLKKDKDIFTKFFGEAVSLTLPQVAASTPEKHNVIILDENYEKLEFKSANIDLVGITCQTLTAPRAYEIADRFRSIGIPVVLGGVHPTALPHEAKLHADSVVIGEAENTWPELINDLEKGRLKQFYRSKEKIFLKDTLEPRRDLLNRKLFNDGILINRGCPNQCEFCTISTFHNWTSKPIENVLKEIKNISSKIILIHDPNFTWNLDYNKRLLIEFKKFNKKWLASGTVDVLGSDDEFLRLAKEAGITSWFIGFESVSQKSLNEVNKKHNRVETFASTIKKIRNYGMSTVGSFIFGFDNDTPDIFNTTFDMIERWRLEMAEFQILTPFPGTKLYSRLKKEGRILTEDWGKYNLANVVFEPKNMSAEELYNGTYRIIKKTYSLSNIIKNFYRSIETTKDFYPAYYVLHRNLWSRLRYKHLFNIEF